jgi:hypothetical protein
MKTESGSSAMEISVAADEAANLREGPVEPIEESDFSGEYHSETDTYRARFDGRCVRPSTAVIKMISMLRGEDPTQMDPLQAILDLDALDTLAPSKNGDDVLISFEYDTYDITIRSD